MKKYPFTFCFIASIIFFISLWTQIWFLLIFSILFYILALKIEIKAIFLVIPLISITLFQVYYIDLNKKDLNIQDQRITLNTKKVYENSVFANYENVTIYLMFDEKDISVSPNDEISIKIDEINKIEEVNSFSAFMKSHKASYFASVEKIEEINYSNNLRNNIYRDLIDQNTRYSNFTLALLYKSKTPYNDYVFEFANELGISHLFIVSGFHISLLFLLIENILKLFIKHKKIKLIIEIILVLFFLRIIFMPLSGVRAFITTIFKNVFNISNNNALSLSGIFFFLYNPWLLLNTSLILSFFITYTIHFIILFKLPKLETSILISLFAFLTAIPIVSTWNNSINLFAPLFTILLTPLISIIYYFLILLLPFYFLLGNIETLFFWIEKILEFLTLFTLDIKIQNLNWGNVLISETIIYILYFGWKRVYNL